MTADKPASGTHERAVLRQDNGELAEDVVETDELDRLPARSTASTPAEAATTAAEEASEESFPASDPPGSWAGVDERHDSDGPAVTSAAERLVDRAPVEHAPERATPDDPVPKTLPRD